MKSLETVLWLLLYDDISHSGSYHGATRDKNYFLSRIEQEGLSFLTITLPAFAVDFERSLDDGYVSASLFRSFRKRGAIPAFLQGMLGRVFDADGRLLDTPCIKAIRDVRQLCRVFNKLKKSCTLARERKAIQDYVKIEEELSTLTIKADLLELFEQVSRELWQFTLPETEIVGKHGPGVTAERLSQDNRRQLRSWPERLDKYFPYYGFYRGIHGFGEDYRLLPADQEQPVRVILVPKTQKTPRVIAAEPAAMQFSQQGLLGPLTEHVVRKSNGIVQFRDQARNGELARNVKNATIDLSSASDRVHFDLVTYMLSHLSIYPQIAACRSRVAELPSGDLIHLKKFASMGSALCFPIEAMVFFTIVMCYYRTKTSRRVSDLIRDLRDRVGIYGDDIIVPVEDAAGVVTMLEAFGLRVNRAKSFWTGKFRESCGKDFYDGQDVKPVYCRSIPTAHDDVEATASMVAFINFCYERNYMRTYLYLRDRYRKIPGSTVEGFVGIVGKEPTVRYNPDLQRREQCVYVVAKRTDAPSLDGAFALEDYFHRSTRSKEYSPLQVVSGFTQPRLKRVWIPI